MKLKSLLTGLMLTGLAATVHADITWDWSYTYSSGEGDTGSGTFTTGNTETTSGISGNTGYLVASITGAFSIQKASIRSTIWAMRATSFMAISPWTTC